MPLISNNITGQDIADHQQVHWVIAEDSAFDAAIKKIVLARHSLNITTIEQAAGQPATEHLGLYLIISEELYNKQSSDDNEENCRSLISFKNGSNNAADAALFYIKWANICKLTITQQQIVINSLSKLGIPAVIATELTTLLPQRRYFAEEQAFDLALQQPFTAEQFPMLLNQAITIDNQINSIDDPNDFTPTNDLATGDAIYKLAKYCMSYNQFALAAQVLQHVIADEEHFYSEDASDLLGEILVSLSHTAISREEQKETLSTLFNLLKITNNPCHYLKMLSIYANLDYSDFLAMTSENSGRDQIHAALELLANKHYEQEATIAKLTAENQELRARINASATPAPLIVSRDRIVSTPASPKPKI